MTSFALGPISAGFPKKSVVLDVLEVYKYGDRHTEQEIRDETGLSKQYEWQRKESDTVVSSAALASFSWNANGESSSKS